VGCTTTFVARLAIIGISARTLVIMDLFSVSPIIARAWLAG
jgi:hypothetical protein